MSEIYEPTSDFLKAVAADEVPLTGSAFAEVNLQRLMQMTSDPDRSNRDWAALLLSQQAIDSPDVRSALLTAAEDEDEYVRGEAILGLAQRDRLAALPFVKKALEAENVCVAVFEAAELVADPSLIALLTAFEEPSADKWLDRLAADALRACRRTPANE